MCRSLRAGLVIEGLREPVAEAAHACTRHTTQTRQVFCCVPGEDGW